MEDCGWKMVWEMVEEEEREERNSGLYVVGDRTGRSDLATNRANPYTDSARLSQK
jgi:hypothetical protein